MPEVHQEKNYREHLLSSDTLLSFRFTKSAAVEANNSFLSIYFLRLFRFRMRQYLE